MTEFHIERDDASAPFFDAARDGRLVIRRCAGCGHLFPPHQTTLPGRRRAGVGRRRRHRHVGHVDRRPRRRHQPRADERDGRGRGHRASSSSPRGRGCTPRCRASIRRRSTAGMPMRVEFLAARRRRAGADVRARLSARPARAPDRAVTPRRHDGGMRYGLSIPNFAEPNLLLDVARAADANGWDGFFLWDHILVERERRRPGQRAVDRARRRRHGHHRRPPRHDGHAAGPTPPVGARPPGHHGRPPVRRPRRPRCRPRRAAGRRVRVVRRVGRPAPPRRARRRGPRRHRRPLARRAGRPRRRRPPPARRAVRAAPGAAAARADLVGVLAARPRRRPPGRPVGRHRPGLRHGRRSSGRSRRTRSPASSPRSAQSRSLDGFDVVVFAVAPDAASAPSTATPARRGSSRALRRATTGSTTRWRSPSRSARSAGAHRVRGSGRRHERGGREADLRSPMTNDAVPTARRLPTRPASP